MAIVILVRHGENDYVKEGRLAGRLPGVHLNKNGRRQAKAVAKIISKFSIKAVYSSPLDRTLETAIPIAEGLGLEVFPRPGLIELDVGKWQNKKLKKLNQKKRWKIVQFAPSRMHFPEGESFLQAQTRVVEELSNLARGYEVNDSIVCVSHADIIKLAVTYFIGLPLDNFQRLHIAPASITVLSISEMHNHLLTLNFKTSFTLP